MKILTEAEFTAGSSVINGIATPLVNAEYVQVVLGNGFTENRTYYLGETEAGEDDSPVITCKNFRDRFDFLSKLKLDQLQDNLQDDATVLALCSNLDSQTLENYRNALRTTFKDLYSAQDEVRIASQEVKDGLNLFLATGVIDQNTIDSVLDLTTLT